MSLPDKLKPLIRDVLRAAALAVVFWSLAELALSHVLLSGWDVAIVWPPSGAALAALLVWGYRLWPGLVIGSALLSIGEASLPQVALTASGVCLEAAGGVFILKRVLSFRTSLGRLYDVAALVCVAALASIIGATIGITSFYAAGRVPWEQVGTEWLKYWLGDAMGILTVAPVILTWSTRPKPSLGRKGIVEATILAVALVAALELVFGGRLRAASALGALGGLFPFLVLAALRFGTRGASTAVFVASAFGAWGTAHGRGPFVEGNLDERMFLLWTFLGLVALTTLLLGAVTEERQRARSALRESEERFRGLVENANDIIFSLSTDGGFSYVSPNWTHFLGHRTSEVLGQPFERFVHPDDIEPVRRSLHEVIETGQRQSDIECRVRHSDGSWRWYSSSLSALKSEGGKVLLLIGIAHDISEVKKALGDLAQANADLMEAQGHLIQSEKMAALGMLVAGIAHEINTPVGAIHSMNATLKAALAKLGEALKEQSIEDNRKLHAPLQVIEDATKVMATGCERIANIVKRLRTFARLDEAELKTVDIHEGLDDTLALVHPQMKHDIRVTKHYGEIPRVACFPDRLNQVFLNLLVNASQAIKDKGEISIRTFVKQDKVHIEISDTGVGMPKEKLARIFDPGYTTKGVGVGTGLGLSICYKIMQDHEGEIRVESEPDKGSMFTVIFPADLDRVFNLT